MKKRVSREDFAEGTQESSKSNLYGLTRAPRPNAILALFHLFLLSMGWERCFGS